MCGKDCKSGGCSGNCSKYKNELKKIYRLSSKLTGRYKNLFSETSRFTVGLLDTNQYEEGLCICEEIQELLENTKIFD